jgi:hypothetical protein
MIIFHLRIGCTFHARQESVFTHFCNRITLAIQKIFIENADHFSLILYLFSYLQIPENTIFIEPFISFFLLSNFTLLLILLIFLLSFLFILFFLLRFLFYDKLIHL